tara:strand:+ start:64 stop:912 length:849 start_codon:yes stop_codon:yes gene_type:complete
VIKKRFLSLGAGVQSSALALMITKGEIPAVEAGIFADTGAEPEAVYKWLDWLKSEVSFPIYRAKIGDLYWHTLWFLNNMPLVDDGLSIPFFTKTNTKRGIGMMVRQCTYNYKILPVTMKIRNLLNVKKHKKINKKIGDQGIDLLLGISYDEALRMKQNKNKYFNNIYPLVDLKINRQDCIDWIKKNYNKTPPRSSCIFCPYHSNKEWLKIKENKNDWDKLVKFDRGLRDNKDWWGQGKRNIKNKNNLYLHHSCKPIEEVDFKIKDDNKSNLTNACEEGYCGI